LATWPRALSPSARATVASSSGLLGLSGQNSFALRSLASLLVIAGAFAAGVARFRQALAIAPGNLVSTYNLAQALLELDPEGHRDEADRLLLQVIEAQHYGELANKAKDLRGSVAARDLRGDQPDGLRQDAVSYCLQALQLFEGIDVRSGRLR
jgi:tetratricopeptide (TPR) repeat protein